MEQTHDNLDGEAQLVISWVPGGRVMRDGAPCQVI